MWESNWGWISRSILMLCIWWSSHFYSTSKYCKYKKYSLLVPYHERQCIPEKCRKIFIVYVWQKKWAFTTAIEWERKWLRKWWVKMFNLFIYNMLCYLKYSTIFCKGQVAQQKEINQTKSLYPWKRAAKQDFCVFNTTTEGGSIALTYF